MRVLRVAIGTGRRGLGRRGGEPGCDGLGWGSRRCEFVPLREISPNLQHAVVSAEDARFYLHHGFDWHQV
ncbi:MAG: transglycosylase domain-containing protein [Terriglobia bacterium]|nr:transglycosylase domain-containing protein [Terriglobia bacterium]